MIKIPEWQVIPRFYLPVKYSVQTRTVECYLFFIAPFAMLYEKIANRFYYFWYNLIIFKDAREIMNKALKDDEGLYQGYKANIAMCIYDSRRNDGRLNHQECNEVADKLIKLIFD